MNLLNNWVKGREEKREQYRQMPKRNFTKKKKKIWGPRGARGKAQTGQEAERGALRLSEPQNS